MSQTIATLQSNLQRKLHGTSLSKIDSPFDLIGEAAGNLISRIDPQETIRSVEITNGLFDEIYDYTAPSDLKGKKVIDIRRQANRTERDNFVQRLSKEFDLRRDDGTFQVKYSNGIRSLRIAKELGSPIQINALDGIDTNGTWAVGDDATNLKRDTIQKVQGSASLRFDLDGATMSGYIENSTMSQVDLTEHDELSSLFTSIYLPNASLVTNVILRFGNDGSNYWTSTATTAHDSTSFQNGWNIVRFGWDTEVGTVNPAQIDYLRIIITYDGTASVGYRADSVISALKEIFILDYYSKYLFQNSSGTFLENPSSLNDTVNLDTDSYNILLYETAYLAAQEVQGEDSSFDVEFFRRKKEELYKEYAMSNVSEEIKPQSRYYRTVDRRYPIGRRDVN